MTSLTPILKLRYAASLSLCLLLSSTLFAQNEVKDRCDKFLKNNVYVVFTGSEVLDSALKESFSAFWTITPIKGFISKKELKDLIADESNSFFYTTPYQYSIDQSNKFGGRSTSCIFAFNGGRKSTNRYNLLYESVTLVYFNTFGSEEDMDNAAYRMPLMVADLQQGVQYEPPKSTNKVAYKEKILIVNEKLLDGGKRTKAFKDEAMGMWPWKYEALPESKIASLIRAKDSRYMLLTPVLSDMKASITLYDLATMESVAVIGRINIVSTPWVRGKEIELLVEKLKETFK